MLTQREYRLRKPLASSALAILLSAFPLPASSLAQADVTAIIQKSVEANNRDWDADPQFAYTEQDLDGKGVRKTYNVTNVLGTPYEHLIAINGKPLSASQNAEEQRKHDRMLSERKSESPEKRSHRIAKFRADRRRDHAMLDELTKAFDFHLQGEQKLGRYDVYVLKAAPRQGYKPPNRDTQVLPGMKGRLWIDKNTYQWVKVEAEVTRPVTIEGFVAQVQPGTRFELDKAPVEGDIWLTTHYSMKASAKVLFLFPHHSQEDDTYTNYHRQGLLIRDSEGPGK